MRINGQVYVFTPTGLQPRAQGREQRERTLRCSSRCRAMSRWYVEGAGSSAAGVGSSIANPDVGDGQIKRSLRTPPPDFKRVRRRRSCRREFAWTTLGATKFFGGLSRRQTRFAPAGQRTVAPGDLRDFTLRDDSVAPAGVKRPELITPDESPPSVSGTHPGLHAAAPPGQNAIGRRITPGELVHLVRFRFSHCFPRLGGIK